MGLFETVQLELFELMGYKKREPLSPKFNQHTNQQTQKLPNKSTSKLFAQELSFEDFPCPVELVRKNNLRGLRFRITTQAKLEISANKSSSEREIISLIRPHLNWIEKQAHTAQKRLSLYPQKKWRTGESFLWNGRSLELVFSPSSTKKPHIRFMENSFEYFYPLSWQELTPADLQEKLHSNFLYFFKLKASELLDAKVDHWAKKMGLFPKSVSYRNQKTRWGSCSSDGKMNLNWKLAVFKSEIQDYVVIHELAHLKHQDHSKNFWNLVEVYCPDRKIISRELHDSALNVDPFASSSELYDHNPGLV